MRKTFLKFKCGLQIKLIILSNHVYDFMWFFEGSLIGAKDYFENFLFDEFFLHHIIPNFMIFLLVELQVCYAILILMWYIFFKLNLICESITKILVKRFKCDHSTINWKQ
jgi:hypothetical protein